MNRQKRKKLGRELIRRDGYLCGLHIGGCGKEAGPGSEADIDHMFPRAFFKDTKFLCPRDYDDEWNLQRMHVSCHRDRKRGFLTGFPVFRCKCHWLQIRRRREKYALVVSYRQTGADVCPKVVVPYGKFNVGEGRISDPKGLLPSNEDHVLVSSFEVPDRGMSISKVTVDISAAFSGGRQSFSYVGRARKGTLREGENVHIFPLLAPGEVAEFNQFEEYRVKRDGGMVDRDNLLATFNSQVIHLEVEYDQ